MIEQMCSEIEEGTVWGDLMLASTLPSLIRRMETNTSLMAYRRAVAERPALARFVLGRVRALYAAEGPQGTMHPQDLAIAAYVHLLSHSLDPEVQAFLTGLARDNRRGFHWTTSTARYYTSQVPGVTARPAVAAAPSDSLVILHLIYEPDVQSSTLSARPAAPSAQQSSSNAVPNLGPSQAQWLTGRYLEAGHQVATV